MMFTEIFPFGKETHCVHFLNHSPTIKCCLSYIILYREESHSVYISDDSIIVQIEGDSKYMHLVNVAIFIVSSSAVKKMKQLKLSSKR